LLQLQARNKFPRIADATLKMMEGLGESELQQLGKELLALPDARSFRSLLQKLKQQSSH
jgi:hypothetical protein